MEPDHGLRPGVAGLRPLLCADPGQAAQGDGVAQVGERWSAPRLVFVDSMSDLFHDDVPPEFIAQVFEVIRQTPQHTYQVLTKRAQRLNRHNVSSRRRVAGPVGETLLGAGRHHGARRRPR